MNGRISLRLHISPKNQPHSTTKTETMKDLTKIYIDPAEPFFSNGKYYYSLSDLIDEIVSDDCDIEDLPDDYEIKATRAELLPIIQYKADDLLEMADEFSEENCDREVEQILNAIKECCDFDKLNSMIPKLWYEMPTERFVITKKDLLNN